MPEDSRVEIDAKITAGEFPHPLYSVALIGLTRVQGYFTTGHRMTEEELAAVKGRTWEE
jgi:hypothetical protein